MGRPARHIPYRYRMNFGYFFIILFISITVIIPAVLGNSEVPWDWQVTTKLGNMPIRPPDGYYLPTETMIIECNITPPSSITIGQLSARVTYNGSVIYPIYPESPRNLQLRKNQTHIIGYGTIDLTKIATKIPKSSNKSPTILNLEIVASANKSGIRLEESHIIEFWVGYPGTIEIIKFHDRNENRQKDSGEEGLAGWKFTITGNNVRNDNFSSVVTTMNNGSSGKLEILPGIYTIKEESRSDWTPTTQDTQNVGLSPGEDMPPIYFGNLRNATLSVLKFDDVNKNGQHDVDEPGLEGWTFDIKETDSGKKIDIATTNGEGVASLGLRPGRYTVKENKKPEWNSSTPDEQVVTLGPAEIKEISFGNYLKPAQLHIIKFHDLNRNGQQDLNEPGMQGWKFAVSGKDYLNQDYTNSVTTDNNGVSILEVRPGTYTISEEKTRKDWISTTQMNQTITLGPDDRRTIRFGNDINSSFLNITKIRAVDENGRLVPSGGIAGWKLTISGRDYLNQDYQNTVTTESNGVKIIELRPGTYTVKEEMRSNWSAITPEEQTVTLNPGDVKELPPFINYLNQHIYIYKFNDTNRNGIYDPGEELVPGWEFLIEDSSGSSPTINETNTQGMITIKAKPNTKYTVTEYLQPGWNPTTATQQNLTTDFETPNFPPIMFGNHRIPPPAPTIIVSKFEDTNKNGKRDIDEAGLGGWDFDVMGPLNGPDNKTIRVTTNENGNVIYNCTVPGRYIVKEVKKSGCWISTTNDTVKVNALAGQKVPIHIEFGNYEICHHDTPTGLQNQDVLVQKFVDPSQLTTNMIGNCNETYLDYTIQIHPKEKAEATDLVISINEMVPKTENSQRTIDTVVNGVSGFLGEHAMKSNSSSRVGLIRWIGNESNEIYPTANYTDLSNKIMDSQFIQTNTSSAFAYWTYGIIDKFYKLSPPETKKILLLVTDSESRVSQPIEAINANYTIHAIAIGGKETDTTRLLRNITSGHHGKLYFANNSAEMQSDLTELAWITKPTILKSVQLTDTLPSYLMPVSYQVNPPEQKNITANNDGRDWHTSTTKWWIGNLSSSGRPWNTSFTVRFCWVVPADIHQTDVSPRISQVNYVKEDGSMGAIQVPEGAITIRRSSPVTERTPGFQALVSMIGLLASAYLFRKKR